LIEEIEHRHVARAVAIKLRGRKGYRCIVDCLRHQSAAMAAGRSENSLNRSRMRPAHVPIWGGAAFSVSRVIGRGRSTIVDPIYALTVE
jgi:hypothetical protein